ncbi:N-acetylmuramoyl-L-alanine amidase [Oceanicola sp. S124]|uniref:N-acetylmuramoyl-L-alanine amidase n=1 Tax=Oceanicola sp. S124 TaxID=1042378 RepID=UPI000255A9E3|nr:N-acetylmuramoyl-L-alanine amidase [Oceanicola sp. S124]
MSGAAGAPGRIGAPGALWHPSPNHGDRRDGLRPGLVVLHHTAMQSAEAALERLCDATFEAPVSAHYLIAEDGRLWQLVDERARAWHAGAGSWGGRGDVNSRSIGIELANPAPNPYAEPQMARLEALLRGILARWRIPPEGVIAHSDMAPGRKTDPGPKFDWRRLARQGLSVWPDAQAAAEGDLAEDLARIGYPSDDMALALQAFRLRFRPWARGGESAADRIAARDIAARFAAGRG